MLSGEATNINFIVFGLTRAGLEWIGSTPEWHVYIRWYCYTIYNTVFKQGV